MSQLTVGYIFDAELVRLAIILSAVISLFVYERYGIAGGGTIVAGYLALFITQPTHIAVTLGIALATYWLVHKYLRPRLMLWGRRLFEAEILIALGLNSLWFLLLWYLSALTPDAALFYGIGFLLPGVMAHDMGRQGPFKTMRIVLYNALVIFGILLLVSALRDLAGIGASSIGDFVVLAQPTYSYPVEWLIIAVNISVFVNIYLYHRWGIKEPLADDAVRTGGFVTAAYLALFLGKPADIAIIVVSSLLTYGFVVYFLMPRTLLFGRSKLCAMFTTAFVITALVEWAAVGFGMDIGAVLGFNAIVPTLVALLANDAQRQGLRRTLAGAAMSTATIFTAMSALVLIFGV